MVQPSNTKRKQRWEPRENRGRLRHCDGLQTPKATGSARSWEGGSEARSPQSGHQRGYARQVPPARDRFSDKEKDEASPLNRFSVESSNAFIPAFAGA